MNDGCLNKIGLGLACLLVWALLFCFFSCSSVKYVPIETVKERIEYRDRLQRDSIHVHDSIYIHAKGDTMYYERWKTVYKDRLLHDTCYINNTDTISVPYPVEKKLSSWQQFKIEIGGWAFGITIAFVLFVTIWLIYKKRIK